MSATLSALVARATNENGIPDIHDPWPAKDVGVGKHGSGGFILTPRLADCLRCYRWQCHASSSPRMVSLVSSLSLLPGQGLPEGREHEYKSAFCSHDDHLLRIKVREAS